MQFSQWFRPPQHLLSLFLAMTLTLAAALGWLGWRLFQQDRALESQRMRERVEYAADLISAALLRSRSETDERLSGLAATPGGRLDAAASAAGRALDEDAALVVLRSYGIESHPPGRVPYSPEPAAALAMPSSSVFAAAEALEFQQRDYAAAIAALRELARSDDPAIRAGALLRLARNLRKGGQAVAALATYSALRQLGSTPVEGLPAGLLARHARCTLYDELNRRAELREEAHAFYADLQTGRWPVTRAAYRFYTEETWRWMELTSGAAAEAKAREREALGRAQAVEWIWNEWQTRPQELAGPGTRTLWLQDRSVLLLWRGGGDHVVALVAGPRHLERTWLQAVQPILGREGVKLALTDVEGHRISGPTADGVPGQALRAANETRLPWNLHVVSSDPRRDLSGLAARRRLLFAGLATMAVFVLIGSALIARAVTRELEVARLQKDFVSAVSHEFRTPLASMLQLSELLTDGRVSSEARRQEYYRWLYRESERLHHLVETLLDFGRMEAGAREYRFEEIDPAVLVRAVAEEFAQKVEERGYQVEVTLNGPLPRIRADREAVGLSLWNLLDNAVKYSPAGKTVWLEAAREDGRVAIRVRDKGLGIEPAEQRQIFKKFARAASAQAAGVKGTGLGLAMVHHIVAAHGGAIHVESQPGAGSTFTMLFPIARG